MLLMELCSLLLGEYVGKEIMGRTVETRASPSVILVEPQLSENIGTVARAMLNFGLTDLRLVAPRADWRNEKARATASGANIVLDSAKTFQTSEAAVADLHTVYAMTGRRRDMTKVIMAPEKAAGCMYADVQVGKLPGMLFGPEASGLNNDDIALSDAVVSVPTNDDFKSLNLAMAVLLLGYEWFLKLGSPPLAEALELGQGRPATKKELHGLFDHLEGALDACGFFRVREKRPHMVRSIRNIFQRSHLSEQEVRTFRGVISGLATHAVDHRKITNDG